MLNILEEIRSRRCPKCQASHALDIIPHQYRIICRACNDRMIDPFEVGPWNEKHPIIDYVDGKPVTTYYTEEHPSEEHTLDDKWGEFFKYVFQGQNERVIKGG